MAFFVALWGCVGAFRVSCGIVEALAHKTRQKGAFCTIVALFFLSRRISGAGNYINFVVIMRVPPSDSLWKLLA